MISFKKFTKTNARMACNAPIPINKYPVFSKKGLSTEITYGLLTSTKIYIYCLEKNYGSSVAQEAVFIHLCAMTEAERNLIILTRFFKNKIHVLYGIDKVWLDVSDKVFEHCFTNNCLYIPAGDINRLKIFEADPVIGVVKSIIVCKNNSTEIFDEAKEVKICLD